MVEYKTALSLEEAFRILNDHEIVNTVRFSAIFSTKDFGNTGKSLWVFRNTI